MTEVIDGLKPYKFHRVELEHGPNDKEANGDCPFCGREGKFNVNIKTSKWRCVVCDEKGNQYTFIERLWEDSFAEDKSLTSLAKEREISVDTLRIWGVCRSVTCGSILVPGYDVDGKLRQLYRYVKMKTGKMRLLPTPSIGHAIHGVNLYNKKKPVVYLCEGPWDAMKLYEVFSTTKEKGSKFVQTNSKTGTMIRGANILASPGCAVFNESWGKLFTNKIVYIVYDNDHPHTHPKTGKVTEPAAYAGIERVSHILGELTKETNFLQWGDNGYDLELPHGTDIRDLLSDDINGGLSTLFELMDSVPEDWKSTEEESESNKNRVYPVECESWKEVSTAWRKALKWGFGFDTTLSVMMASVVSTDIVGDQLWIKVIGPASCISGDTRLRYVIRRKDGKIVNKKGGKLSKLFTRFHSERDHDFTIQSIRDDGSVFRNEIKDVLDQGIKIVYELVTSSGCKIESTRDHRVMTPDGYSRLDELSVGSFVMTNPCATKSRGQSPVVHRPEVLVRYHGSKNKKVVNGCTYYRRKIYQLVYEAEMNGMSYEELVSFLNEKSRKKIDSLWRIPKGMHIHHKDENFNNNEVSNLQLVDPVAHGKEHGKGATEWVKIFVEPEEVVSIKKLGLTRVYDVVVASPYRNFVANEVVVHNCGKSTLCEALSVAKKYVLAKSTIRGFHSGFKSKDDTKKDNSLIVQVKNKTLITKDGDTLLQSPNLGQILSEARDIYDKTSRTHYRNEMSKEYTNINMTWILCGTSSLRSIDQSELGERFLDCVIMEGIDEEFEDEVLMRVVRREDRNISAGTTEAQSKEMTRAMQLTGGYIEYLRQNDKRLLGAVTTSEDYLRLITKVGKFVAYMRARPSDQQKETNEREFAPRLVSQHLRLAKCLAVVLNRPRVDEKVMERVVKVALDTSRGITYEMCKFLWEEGELGSDNHMLSTMVNRNEQDTRKLLRFLTDIGVLESFAKKTQGVRSKRRWRLTPSVGKLFDEIHSQGGLGI